MHNKYCKPGHHFVTYMVKRYCIIAKFNPEHIAIRAPKQVRMCKQCVSYSDGWSLTLKGARIGMITRTLAEP